MKPDWRAVLIIVAVAALVGGAAYLPAIPQPQEYHQFAATATVFGIPHFADVISNLPFLVVGLTGLTWTWSQRPRPDGPFIHASERWPYLVVFGAIALVSIGSAYYHWAPTHERLFWDRLPMSVAFMAIFAAILGERIDHRVGLAALPALILAGTAATTWWLLSERMGAGDLRPYVMVQVVPIVVGILLILLYRSRYDRGTDFIAAATWYLLALAAETLDHPIHDLTGGWLSGHTLKHLLAATAIYWLLRMLRLRRALPTPRRRP
ncbi:alkaline phytoceramidase [Thioalkalivibrio nitratireducens DSM 14787]|uniref:Alkaline phytoceramidase n=1 Tax=Thioalkalivibrio nitratireducens (strain DSM 14787 / UNIQEM 213 / ALEN2) TaxID=1255043 RepID=L0DVL3_THIND|nr:ceramidase domain-containing protein [Thioalkalivibrio nitratireducens]AGA33073.1 alkaline phytoceramidase [Thioalkalivibrio nitratireducens DSM 14787]